jgi:transposase
MEAFGRVRDGLYTVRVASEKLGISYRQAKRLWKRYREGGDSALTHRGRGVAPNNHI